MVTRLKEKVIAFDLFDERSIHEVTDPANPSRRYCLCRNPATGLRESATRQRFLDLTTTALQDIAAYKRKTTVEKLGTRVGKVLTRYKMGKFIQWSIDADKTNPTSRAHRLLWSIDSDKVALEKKSDGCYIISTDVDKDQMNTLTWRRSGGRRSERPHRHRGCHATPKGNRHESAWRYRRGTRGGAEAQVGMVWEVGDLVETLPPANWWTQWWTVSPKCSAGRLIAGYLAEREGFEPSMGY
jgi:hypothetical protein